jgi:tRNA G18 (ribose-2'-O)-methylase SpoU
VIDAYRLISNPAALARAGLFVAEGRLVVERLLADGRFRVHSVLVTPAAARALASVLERRPDQTVYVRDPDVLREITGFNFHRGCLALAYREPESRPRSAVPGPLPRIVLAIEGVGDPDNVGGLFRTALAFGVESVVIDDATADPLYRKAVRTSMAATLRVPYVRASPWSGALDDLRRQGYELVALTPRAGGVALADVAARAAQRLAIVVGAEGPGLSDETLAKADMQVRIPVDPRADSLNVVNAAAIALYALAPRLTGTGS